MFSTAFIIYHTFTTRTTPRGAARRRAACCGTESGVNPALVIGKRISGNDRTQLLCVYDK